jgi:hypothetical protein
LKELISAVGREPVGLYKWGEEQLKIYLVVGKVDTAGVVYRVRVYPSATKGELNAGLLREAEVPTFPNDSGP